MTQGNQTYSVPTRVWAFLAKPIPERYVGKWGFGRHLACSAYFTFAPLLVMWWFFDRENLTHATFSQAEVFDTIKRTRAQYQKEPLPKSAREEVEAMVEIAWRESRFDPKMQNPKSSSHQLFGFLKGTCKNYGGCGDTMSHTRNALAYCYDRYGSPKRALDFHKRNQYY